MKQDSSTSDSNHAAKLEGAGDHGANSNQGNDSESARGGSDGGLAETQPGTPPPRPVAPSPDQNATQSQLGSLYGTLPGFIQNGTNSLAQTLITGAHQVAPAVDLTNCLLGEFRLLRRLGAGGMAQVYLAEQTSLKRLVAIKVMRPDMGSDETYRKRFEHEAKAAAGLNHRNIVQVYAVGESDGVRYIAQEYVQGLNLRQYLQRKRPPSAALGLRLLKQVCSALHAAHSAGIVHRDIKPENIMVTRKMVAKVTDFGLAQLTQAGERVNLTQMGVTMGTPLYMSPEQINGADVDLRSDLYSLGVSFFHLLAGEPPFQAPTQIALAYKHVNESPPNLGAIRPDLPQGFVAVILKLMGKKPEDRYPDARSVMADLKSVDAEEEGGDWNSEAAAQAQPLGWFSIPKRNLKRYAITCLLVFLVAIAIGKRLRRPDPLDAPVTRVTSVSKMGSAKHQFAHALSLKNDRNLSADKKIEAFEAVLEHYPNDLGYRLDAQLRLGVLYIDQKSLEKARDCFEELARASHPGIRANGFAGLAVLANLNEDYRKSHELIRVEVLPHGAKLDPDLRTMILHTVISNNRQLATPDVQLERAFAPASE